MPICSQVCPGREGDFFRQDVPGTLGSCETEMKREHRQRYDLE